MDEARNLKGLLVRFKVRAGNPNGDKREAGQMARVRGQWPSYISKKPVPAEFIDVEWGERCERGCPYCGSLDLVPITDVEILGPPP